jgi:hypothetical protein
MRLKSFVLVAAMAVSTAHAGQAAPANGDPAWRGVVKLPDGRTLVTDGKMALDVELAKPNPLPTNVAGSGPVIDKHLRASWPDEFTPGQLSKGPRPGMYISPSGVVLGAMYVDYLRRTLPAGQWRLRMKGTYEPVIILVNGTPSGVLMAMVPPK